MAAQHRRPGFSGPSFFDNQNDNLVPRRESGLGPRSDSGQTDLSFRSATSIYDRGVNEYAKEHGKLERDPSPRCSSLTEAAEKISDVSSMDELISEAIYEPADPSLKRFLPLDKLDSLITPPVLEKLLQEGKFPPEEVTRMTSAILGETDSTKPEDKSPGLRRIFAILVMVRRIEAIEKFIQHGIDDSVLPLKIRAIDFHCPESGLKHIPRCETKSKFDNSKIESCLWGFSKRDLRHFDMYQQEVDAPFFRFPSDDGDFCFYDLDGDCVLPFTNVDPGETGGSGKVSRVQIHPAHHNYADPRKKNEDIYFAWKKLHRDNEDEFRQEVENLERLSAKRGLRNDHLMHLELACRHGKDCYLVFPWADGDLTQFWKHKNRSRDCFKHDDVIWFFNQCLGLSTGLRHLHDLHSFERRVFGADGCYRAKDLVAEVMNEKSYGRHGDIKPENILWFRDYNGNKDHLMITDFGLTEFHSRDSRSHRGLDGLAVTDTYQSPDTFLTGKVTRKYDVWSLGCVFVEFVSWFFLDGLKSTEAFSKARLPDTNEAYRPDTFFDIDRIGEDQKTRSARVKPGVLKWINKIRDLDYCPGAVYDFLHLIESHMLQPELEKRYDSAFVRMELQKIYKRCLEDESYAIIGCFSTPSSTANWRMQEPEEPKDIKTEELDFPVVTEQMVSEDQNVKRQAPRISLDLGIMSVDNENSDSKIELDWSDKESETGIFMTRMEAILKGKAQWQGEHAHCNNGKL